MTSDIEKTLENLLGASNELEPPQNRIEKILHNILGGSYELEPPQRRVEELLLMILEKTRRGEITIDLE